MSMYRKKPVEVEALQYTGNNKKEVLSFVYPDMTQTGIGGAVAMDLPIVIETLEGDLIAAIGDFIIKGVKGEFYPCKPDIFKMTYNKVGDTV